MTERRSPFFYMPAPKGNKNAVGNKGGGRPTLYHDGLPEVVEKLCKLGATDAEICDFLEIGETTLDNWKREHVEFCESLKRGKLIADAEVASKLFHRATGYEHPDTHISNFQGVITETPVTKHYPPDTTAAIFWLKNRRRVQWRDKVETGLTDKDGEDLIPKVDNLELARRLAFLLTGAAIKTDKG